MQLPPEYKHIWYDYNMYDRLRRLQLAGALALVAVFFLVWKMKKNAKRAGLKIVTKSQWAGLMKQAEMVDWMEGLYLEYMQMVEFSYCLLCYIQKDYIAQLNIFLCFFSVFKEK